MTKEIVTLQVGQCGNQVGSKFYERLCGEHGIGAGGALEEEKEDRKEVFFYESSQGLYHPRSLLIDLEPGVIGQCMKKEVPSYASDLKFMSEGGGGAGNNWARGYYEGESMLEEILEAVDKEVESCDQLDGFMLFHSIGGGTGSGCGSLLLTSLQDRYLRFSCTASVLPSTLHSDVVVHPYNAILTLCRLIENNQMSLLFDNDTLEGRLGASASIALTNNVVSNACALFTSPLRFPSYLNHDLLSLSSSLIPVPSCHFIIPSLLDSAPAKGPNEIAHALIQARSQLIAPSPKGSYISAIQVVRAASHPISVSVSRQIQRKKLAFVPWVPPAVLVYEAPSLPGSCGAMFSNHTSVRYAFQAIVSQFDKLYKKQTYLHSYTQYPLFQEDLHLFDEAREAVQGVVQAYKALERPV